MVEGLFQFVPSSYYVEYLNGITNNVNCCDFTIVLPDGTVRRSNRIRYWTQDSLSSVVLIPLPDKLFKTDATGHPLIPMGAISGLYADADPMIYANGYSMGTNLSNPVRVSFGNFAVGYAGVDNDIDYNLASKVYMWTYLLVAYLHPKGLKWVIGDKPITQNAGIFAGTLPSSPPVIGADTPMFQIPFKDNSINLPVTDVTATLEDESNKRRK